MTIDTELNGWREAWLAQKVVTPEVHPPESRVELPAEMARAHSEYLDEAIHRMRFRFWKWQERNFLAGLRRQLDDGDVQPWGWRMRRRRKMKGGLNI